MISKDFGVNAAMDRQCVNVPKDGFPEITSETECLVFVESKPGD